MDLSDRIQELQGQVRVRRQVVKTEEAIKTALVMPFIRALGYEVFDPFEVVPSYVHDGAPKVDYAIRDGEENRILLMLSSTPSDLTTERASRLADAFGKAEAACAILTDGAVYRIHADVDEKGRMDEEPILVLDFGSSRPVDPSGIEQLCMGTFDMNALAAGAKDRRFKEAVGRAIGDELADPSEAFVDIVAKRLADANVAPRDDMFQTLVGITASLSRAIAGGPPSEDGAEEVPGAIMAGDDRLVTKDENEAYQIVRAIAARYIKPERVFVRPAKSYCAVLLDDNNRKSIVRLHFNSQTVRYVGTFVDKDETRESVTGPLNVFDHEDKILARLRELDPQSFEPAE